MDEPLTGGCGCGAVRFALDAPPAGAAYCHCTRCQRRSGTAAAANARIVPGSMRVTRGADLIAYWRPEGGWPKAFCSACGSAIFSEHPDDPAVRGVRMGAFDRDPGVRPSYHQYTAYAAAWEPLPDDGLPRYPEARPPDA